MSITVERDCKQVETSGDETGCWGSRAGSGKSFGPIWSIVIPFLLFTGAGTYFYDRNRNQ